MSTMLRAARLLVLAAAAGANLPVLAASGEMGAGVPIFGMYSAATGTSTIVWSLAEATTPFPSGCERLTLSPETMGMDAYKLAVGTLVAARLTNKRVRFYAHAPRDNGCGIDYLQIVD